MYGYGTYTASFNQVSISAVQDLWEILFPSDCAALLLGIYFSQNTDVADAEEEILYTSLRRVTGAPTSGSGGSTPTPRPTQTGMPASGATVEANNTTQLSGGTNVVLEPIEFNLRLPDKSIYIPEERYIFSPSERVVLELEKAPADAITASGFIKWTEIGG